jgi:hypothetical protein
MKLPFLHNVRRGLATNSSSSHSLVYSSIATTEPEFATDPKALEQVRLDAAMTDNEFGWNGPTISSLGEKLMYALTDRIGGHWGDFTQEQLAEAKEKYGALFPEFEGQDALWVKAANGYVDHQSIGTSGDMDTVRNPSSYITIDNDNH